MNRTEVIRQLDLEIKRLQDARSILADGAGSANVSTNQAQEQHRGPRRISANARRRIAEAQRARWAKLKGAQKPSAPTPITMKTSAKKASISAEGRARIAAAQKKRWAKQRKAAA